MHYISDEILTLETIKDIVANKLSLMLSEDSRERINRCRNYIDERMKNDKSPVYGVNTGFGALYNVSVSEHDLEKLQCNLVTSHACGMGDEVPKEIVRLMLLLKIQSLSYGHSGVQESTVDRLIDFYNHDMLPVIYEQGSLGASGDLAPLAHLSLPLIELGEVNYRNKKMATAIAYSKSGLKPVHLKSKEGLAL